MDIEVSEAETELKPSEPAGSPSTFPDPEPQQSATPYRALQDEKEFDAASLLRNQSASLSSARRSSYLEARRDQETLRATCVSV